MRSRKKQVKGIFGNALVQKGLRIMTIPLIVIILILVIVIMDRSPDPDKKEESQTESETDSVSGESGDESVEPDNNQYVHNFEQYELKKDEIPEINTLMESYCKAKTDCDAQAMYTLYGKTDMTGVEELHAKMQMRAKYIESFQNITCYTKQGLDENSYVVYVSADIKFRVTDTLAPNLMWCYVTKNEEGQFYIVENIPADVAAYVEEVERSEDVRLLAAQVNTRLEEAAASDSKLASAYGMLKEGATFDEQTASSAAEASEIEAPAETEIPSETETPSAEDVTPAAQ